MRDETLLSILNCLGSQARICAHATFGLAESCQSSLESVRQAQSEEGRGSLDALLRALDDLQDLVMPASPSVAALEEFDVGQAVAGAVELLSLASAHAGAGLLFRHPVEEVRIRQDRGAVDQVLARVLAVAVQREATSTDAAVDVRVATVAGGVRLLVEPADGLAAFMAECLNVDPHQARLGSTDDLMSKVTLMVAGRHIRECGGEAGVSPAGGTLEITIPNRPAESPCMRPAGLNVLVTEACDERYALTESLLLEECVWRAHDGAEAIDMVGRRGFDLMLMDIHAPAAESYSAIRAIREWETLNRRARTPIVAISNDFDQQRRSAAQAGCSGFLRKPPPQRELLELVDRIRASRSPAA